jgi:hypothetical protein
MLNKLSTRTPFTFTLFSNTLKLCSTLRSRAQVEEHWLIGILHDWVAALSGRGEITRHVACSSPVARSTCPHQTLLHMSEVFWATTCITSVSGKCQCMCNQHTAPPAIKCNNNLRLWGYHSGDYEDFYLPSFPHAVISACCVFYGDFLLGLLFDCEGGGEMFLCFKMLK